MRGLAISALRGSRIYQKKRLEALALRQGIGNLSLEDIHKELMRSINQSNLKSLQTVTGKSLLSKPEILQAKSSLISLAKQGMNSYKSPTS